MKATDLEKRYSARNYRPLPVELTRGEGIHLWDVDGKRYIDMMSAYSAVSFGHGHPELLETLTTQAKRLAVTSRAFHTDRLGPFLAKLCEVTRMDRALPMNTGAEAVETAIKAVRKWGYKVKGIAPERAEIIVCAGNFAGRTTTIVGFSSEPQYRDGFGPFAPGFRHVPFGDAAALEAAITPHTAAFIVEPVQGEAGIIVPPTGYLAACAEICRRHDVLLICDEVQTGLGRTGRVLACEHEGVRPDGITLGKALGGGLLPVSAFVARAEVMDVFAPGDHGSTFGGNALAAAVGQASLELLIRERLSENAAVMGDRLIAGLRALDCPAIVDVRGKGLLIGVEFDPDRCSARTVCERLLTFGILSKDTHDTVVRFAPPLTITAAQIDEALDLIERAFASLEMPAAALEESRC
jgi:ornithine--oxo-acid transaminase